MEDSLACQRGAGHIDGSMLQITIIILLIFKITDYSSTGKETKHREFRTLAWGCTARKGGVGIQTQAWNQANYPVPPFFTPALAQFLPAPRAGI